MIKNDSQPQWQQPKWEWLFPVIIFLILLFLILIIIPLDSLKASKCIEGDCENGQGVYTYASGDKYVGEFKDGKAHGQGIRTRIRMSDYSGRNVKYVGRFEDGLPIETKDWVFVGTDQNHLLGQNHEWYILNESIEKKGDYTYILDLDSFSKFSVTSYNQLDCKTSRVKPKEFTFYDEPMAQGDFESGSDLPPDWIDIDVTPKASIFKALCKTELI